LSDILTKKKFFQIAQKRLTSRRECVIIKAQTREVRTSRKENKKMTIYNLPEYANECAYIVVREYDGEYWFWGAYDDRRTARRAADEIGGEVIEN